MKRVSGFLQQLRRQYCCRTSEIGSRRNRPDKPRFNVVRHIACAGIGVSLLMSGCSVTDKKAAKDLQYLDGEKVASCYKDYSTAIEYPCIDNVTDRAVQLSSEPRNLQRDVEDEVREITLHEAIVTSLSNNEVVATSGTGVGGKLVLTNPTAGVASVYDAAIQETGILFGRRGVDAALADFDTTFVAGMTWGNSVPAPTTFPTSSQAVNFTSSLSKAFATGASVSLNNNWHYLDNNWNYFPGVPAGTLPYSGTIGASFRQPLLAGSGVEYTRTAGPTNPAFGAITGVSQGILIARINQDITLADFEAAVIGALQDIEFAYWDLFLAYRVYDTSVAAHESAFSTWRKAQDTVEVGTGLPEDELQAKDFFYQTRSAVELSLNELYKSEAELRRLLGIPMNDGTVLRPVDEPAMAEFQPDWQSSLIEGLTNRVELRRQKWQIKSLQLQLNAARSLVRPRLDAIASYGINGFGDSLDTAIATMPGATPDSWTAGMQFSMPIGLRQARSQARNYELQLAKANAVLAAQERNVAHDISLAIQDITANFKAAQSSQNRYKAAVERLQIFSDAEKIGRKGTTVDLVVRAQESAALAQRDYFRQVVAYNKAITNLYFATGRLLDYNNVYLAEGKWAAEAYDDAHMRAVERTHATDASQLTSQPGEFASKHPVGKVELQTPATRRQVPTIPESTEPDGVSPAAPNNSPMPDVMPEEGTNPSQGQ